MQYLKIFLMALIILAQGMQASAPVQYQAKGKTKIGTIIPSAVPKKIYSHRRFPSIALGIAFTKTVKEILKNKKPASTQSKTAAENDLLAPLRIFPDDIINSSDEQGDTALHLAAFEGGIVGEALVKYLLDYKRIQINKKNMAGYTPLIESIRNSQYATFIQLVARPEAAIATADKHGRTALDYVEDLPKDDINKAKMLEFLQRLETKNLARASVPVGIKKNLAAHAQAKRDSEEEANLTGNPSEDCVGCLRNLFCGIKS